jgi:predicted glycosyltransferase
MQEAGIAIMLSPDELTPENFANCVDKASALDLHKVPYKLDGADGTAQVLADCYKKHVSS